MLTILGIVSAAIGVVGLFFKWRLAKAKEDASGKAAAQQEVKDLKQGLKEVFAMEEAHEKKVVDIASRRITDKQSGELLSAPVAAPKLSDAAQPADPRGRS